MSEGGAEPVCRADEIPEGRGRVAVIGGRAIAVFRDGGRFFAIPDRCPHAGASLGVGWVEDGCAVCPLHYWRFRLADGRCLSGGEGSIPRFPVTLRDGWIWVGPDPEPSP